MPHPVTGRAPRRLLSPFFPLLNRTLLRLDSPGRCRCRPLFHSVTFFLVQGRILARILTGLWLAGSSCLLRRRTHRHVRPCRLDLTCPASSTRLLVLERGCCDFRDTPRLDDAGACPPFVGVANPSVFCGMVFGERLTGHFGAVVLGVVVVGGFGWAQNEKMFPKQICEKTKKLPK